MLMAKTPKKGSKGDVGQGGDDLAPDAWERFKRAVDVVAKSKPKPKRKSDEKAPKPATKRAKPKKP